MIFAQKLPFLSKFIILLFLVRINLMVFKFSQLIMVSDKGQDYRICPSFIISNELMDTVIIFMGAP